MNKLKNNKIVLSIIISLIVLIILVLGGFICYLVIFNSNYNKEDIKTTTTSIVDNSYKLTFDKEIYDVKKEDESILYSEYKTIIHISGPKEDIAKKIENDINNRVNDMWNNVLDMSSNEYIIDEGSDFGVDINTNVDVNTDKYLSLSVSYDGSFGGVSWIETYPLVYSYESGSQLNINDVCNEGCIDFIYNKINNYISENGLTDSIIVENPDEQIRKSINENFGINEIGLYVTIVKYDLFIGAQGNTVIEIPFAEINNYLKDTYRR